MRLVPRWLTKLLTKGSRDNTEGASSQPRIERLVTYVTDQSGNKLETLALTGYMRRALLSNWESTAIFRIASSAPQAKLVVKSRGYDAPDHPWAKRLAHPNPYESQQEFLYNIFAWLEMAGNSFVVADGSVDRYGGGSDRSQWDVSPSPLYVLRSSTILIDPDPMRRVRYYYQRIKDMNQPSAYRDIRYRPEEMCHTRFWNPLDDIWGMPIQAVLGNTLSVELYSDIYNTSFFERGANISGYLQVDGNLSPQQMDLLRQQFMERHAGAGNAHMPTILEGGMSFVASGLGLREMEFLEGKRMNRENILAAHGVPPALAGIYEYANYANVRAQYTMFWNETIVPRWDLVVASLERFVQQYDPNITLEVTYEGVAALQTPIGDLTNSLYRSVLGGYMTINEARKYLRLKPVSWGNVSGEKASQVFMETLPPEVKPDPSKVNEELETMAAEEGLDSLDKRIRAILESAEQRGAFTVEATNGKH